MTLKKCFHIVFVLILFSMKMNFSYCSQRSYDLPRHTRVNLTFFTTSTLVSSHLQFFFQFLGKESPPPPSSSTIEKLSTRSCWLRIQNHTAMASSDCPFLVEEVNVFVIKIDIQQFFSFLYSVTSFYHYNCN